MTRKIGKHRAEEIRSLHLLDLENLVSGEVTPDQVRLIWQAYVTATVVRSGDAVVVAVSQRHAAVTAFNLPTGIRLVLGQDVRDGADVALAEAVDVAHAASRYQRVFLASCDHYFTPLATEFRLAGCAVTQVIGSALVSADLYKACQSSVRLTMPLAA